MKRSLALLTVVAGCASPATPPPETPAPPTVASAAPPAPLPAAPAAPRYAALFDDLVGRVERAHTFPAAFTRVLGHPWKDDVPALRREFEAATSRDDVLVALGHFQNSLHDTHCHFDPPADRRMQRLQLGVGLWAGKTKAGALDVRIDVIRDPALDASLAVGDEVVSVDGLPVAEWVREHPFESRAIEPSILVSDTVTAIDTVYPPLTRLDDQSTRTLVVVHGGAKTAITLPFRSHWKERVEGPDLDDPPPLGKVGCDDMRAASYGDRALTAIGANVCVYRAKKGPAARVPVVRFLSFNYANHDGAQAFRMLKVDHDLLVRELAGAAGVVLDVHENYGGNNPFLFIEWFSGGPWDHERLSTRVVPAERDLLQRALFGDDAMVTRYEEAAKRGDPVVESRFLCQKEPCAGIRGRESERVTKAPVAIVTGPDCMSSCDTLALTWSRFKLGPVVGKQPAHAYTVFRLPSHVEGPEHEDLGMLRFALSQSEFDPGKTVEGEPLVLDWQAPDELATRKTWVATAVEHATQRLLKPAH